MADVGFVVVVFDGSSLACDSHPRHDVAMHALRQLLQRDAEGRLLKRDPSPERPRAQGPQHQVPEDEETAVRSIMAKARR